MTIYNFFSLQIFGFEVLFKCYKFITCPGKTLKGIRGVRLDNRKVFCASDHRTKYIERIFCHSINYTIY